MKNIWNVVVLLFSVQIFLFSPFWNAPVSAQTAADWYMVGANPERTSWVSEEVRGNLSVDWYHPIEPYIPYKIQPIAANGKIYVSTARGLYVMNAASGNLDWIYPTEVPLGNSPTVATVNGKSTAYIPGYDHTIHAVDAITGTTITGYIPYEAGAGFETNPVVVNSTIYAGNRDGYFYALDAITGALKWRYQTGGPVLYSPAYKNNIVYFASQDMYAYAVNATNGTQIWKSAKLPGSGFYSYWPVIYTDKTSGKEYVVFTGGSNDRDIWLTGEETTLFNSYNLPSGRLPQTASPIGGDWAANTITMDASVFADYFTKYPEHRTTIVLDATNGQEFTYTYNGKQTYAPFSYSGVTRGGSKYPPIINRVDGVFYQQTGYNNFEQWVHAGAPVGWKFGTYYVSEISDWAQASDEPVAVSSGGNIIYWALCCDRYARAFDISIPLGQQNRLWTYWNYSMASNSLIPGYQEMYNDGSGLYSNMDGWQIYSGKNKSKNGIYGKHSMTQSPAVPYRGKLYFLRGNSLIAFSPTGTNPNTPLPLAAIVPTKHALRPPTISDLRQRLESEIQKMTAAGNLKPGYLPSAFYDQYGRGNYTDNAEFGEVFDYFQNPADTVYTLLLAYPQVSSATQQQIKSYLMNSYGPGKLYDFTQFVHIGWENGVNRQSSEIGKKTYLTFGTPYKSPLAPSTHAVCPEVCGYWKRFSPFNFYAAWKYAQIVENSDQATARNIFNSMSSKLESPPSDTWLITKPYFINLYTAGYYGYLQLKQLAGLGGDATVTGYYDHLLNLRVNNFSKDTAFWGDYSQGLGQFYNRVLSLASNFMFLTPELAEYMSQRMYTPVQMAISEYDYVGPYWFINGFDDTFAEGTLNHLYNSPALFQAKAYILNEPFEELVKYLDVPAFARGDLFYIQNLVAALDAAENQGITPGPTSLPSPTPSPLPGDADGNRMVNILDYQILANTFGSTIDLRADFNGSGNINILDYQILANNFGNTN